MYLNNYTQKWFGFIYKNWTIKEYLVSKTVPVECLVRCSLSPPPHYFQWSYRLYPIVCVYYIPFKSKTFNKIIAMHIKIIIN